jgi:hypothetical protein
MNYLPDNERTTLARLMPKLQWLQNDSRGLIQWIVTLNDQERLALMHWAQRRAPWFRSAIRRVPSAPTPRRRRAGRAWHSWHIVRMDTAHLPAR